MAQQTDSIDALLQAQANQSQPAQASSIAPAPPDPIGDMLSAHAAGKPIPAVASTSGSVDSSSPGINPASRVAALTAVKVPQLQQTAMGAAELQSAIDSHLAPDSWLRRGADALLGNTSDAAAALDQHIGNFPLSVGQLAAHGVAAVAPSLAGGAAQSIDKYASDRAQTYQGGIPNDVGSYAGATAGEVAPLLAGGEAGLGARFASLADRGTAFAKGLPVLQKVLSGAAQGALYGSLNPVTDTGTGQSFAGQKLSQTGTGAALGGAIPAIGNTLGGAYNVLKPLANPGAVVRDYLGNLVGDQAGAVAARLRSAPSYVTGSVPTAAQAGGSVALVQAEKALANQSPAFKTALAERDIANNAARWQPLNQLAGDPATMAAAKDARTSAIDPFVSQHLPSGGHLAANRWQGAQDAFQSVLDNPSRMPSTDFDAIKSANKVVQQVRSGAMQEDDGLTALQELGDSAGTKKAQGAFQAAQDAINQNMVDPSGVQRVLATVRNGPLGLNPDRAAKLDALAAGLKSATNINGLAHTTMLDAVRQEASKILGNADAQGALAYAPARNALVQAIDRVAPGYSDYLANYARLSQPLTDMGAASDMVDRLGGGARNSAGSPTLTLPAFNSQLRQLGNLRYPVSPQMQSSLTGIQQDLQRASISNSVRAPGSDTAYNLNTPGWLASKVYGTTMGNSGPVADMVRKLPLGIGPFLTSIKDTGANRVLNAAQSTMLNPEAMAKELEKLRATSPRLLRLLGPSFQGAAAIQAPQPPSRTP